jgi:4-amino-4-deoxy-L-arabinose transferase-like glycosyltransferase
MAQRASSVKRRGSWWPALGVGAVALAVYVASLAPGLTFANHGTDGGDLIAAAYNLGVPHPPGYPTYSLLAWLFTRLPMGAIAYRVNLLSAVCTAGAVALLYACAQYLLPARGRVRLLLPTATALTFAFASLPWSQAVIAEVYGLLALLATLLLWLLLRWRAAGSDRHLWLAALVLGLGLGNHLTLIFVAPAALILLWRQRGRWQRVRVLLPCLVLFLAGLGVYAYLPLAARHNPPVNWGNPVTWDRFLWVVTARQYHPFAFGLEPAAWPGRLAAWADLMGRQFGWWGLALALAGGWWAWHRDRALALAGLAWMVLAGGYAFFYRFGDSYVYLLPVVMLLALCWGEGLRGMLQLALARWPQRPGLPLIVVVLLPLLSLGLHWAAVDPDDDGQAQAYAYQALEVVEAGSLIVVRGDGPTFALWYGLYAEGRRPDVATVNGPLLAYTWYRRQIRDQYPDMVLYEPEPEEEVTIDDLVRHLIANTLHHRPVYATDPAEAWKAWYDFVREQNAPVYRVMPRASGP